MDELDGTIKEALGLLWQAIKRKFELRRPQGPRSEYERYFDKKLLGALYNTMWMDSYSTPRRFPACAGDTIRFTRPSWRLEHVSAMSAQDREIQEIKDNYFRQTGEVWKE